MNGLNAGNLAVSIPSGGPQEIEAMAGTLRAFRDTMRDLRQALARFEALRGVGRAVGSTLDPGAVLDMVIARAVEFSGAECRRGLRIRPRERPVLLPNQHGLEPDVADAAAHRSGCSRRGRGRQNRRDRGAG